MTGRERLNAIVHRKPADRLSWSALVDGNTLSNLPPNQRGLSAIDFYRHIGCDIIMLDGWATPHHFRAPELKWPDGVEETCNNDGGLQTREWRTGSGTLRAAFRSGHPTKYPIDSLQTVGVYREMWEGARFIEHDDTQILAAIDEMIGDDGIVTRFWGISTIPRLLQFDMGLEHFYFLLHDHPNEIRKLIGSIHERELEAFHILANGPCETVILAENTSTYYISPDVYREFNMPHVRDFVDIVHDAGKIAIIHMCGHILNLLQDIRKTGLDGVHALTPPPTGNTPYETALDVLGEDAIIIGAFDPSLFILSPLEEIGPALDRIYTPRLRRANFCMCAFADGISVPLERFLAVKEWMERNGNH